jgi:ribosome-interacting GTPase 1
MLELLVRGPAQNAARRDRRQPRSIQRRSARLHRQKTGDYPFTTLRPVPALTRIGGVLVQLVEIPGLIRGAYDDRGGGRALLGVLRSADSIVYCIRRRN